MSYPTNEKPKIRSLIGMLGLVFGLAAYAFAAASIGDLMVDWPVFAQVGFYVAAGLAWLWPARMVLRWMAKP